MNLSLPLGIDDFAKIREDGFYYIDKTAFIIELLSTRFEANLITRPRRFGKSLTMSMVEDFFDISRDSKAHFDGLEISKETKLCEEWMNKWPVVFLTLKDVEGLNFDDAMGMLRVLVSDLCKKYEFIGESSRVNAADRELFRNFEYQKADKENLKSCLVILTRMMSAHYGKPTILIIDEYDVPLAKASENGYYAEMLDIIRSLLGRALKTNKFLKFAVVTGCLRISKESIFTGVNNFVTDAIAGDSFNEYIGFTPRETAKLLEDADLSDHAEEIRQWYDGYRFGNVEVYCPWAVLNHVNALQNDSDAEPDNYWANTSHNGIIYHFINRKLKNVKEQFDTLMNGGVIITQIEKNLTYDYLTSSVKNFWSLLYLTGYLTSEDPAVLDEPIPKGSAALRIPNEEVKTIFKDSIIDWFNDYVENVDRRDMCDALWNGDTEKAQTLISKLLFQTISFYDYEERYYHAFLAGLFAGDEYAVDSNMEYGTGRPDVVIRDDENQRAIVIEIKYAKIKSEIPAKRKEALKQFNDRNYLKGISDGYITKIGYGITFHEKSCLIDKIQ